MSEITEPARALIERLGLEPHPEGGYFCQTWHSPITLAHEALPEGYSGSRPMMTSILFLLPTGARSALHRVRSEELWLHQQGDDLVLGVGPEQALAEDEAHALLLGQGSDARLQAIVPAGEWQCAEALPGPAGYALAGCVVAPGFDFDDFEMA